MAYKSYKRASLQVQKKAIELYKTGMSLNQIGREVGYTTPAISLWFKKYGVEIKLRSKMVNCSICGDEKSVFPKDIRGNKTGNFFCSKKCFQKWNIDAAKERFLGENNPRYKPKVKVECATCGEPMSVNPGRVPETGNVYCGQECQHKGMISSIELSCDICGKSIIRNHAYAQRQEKHFCSSKCASIHNSGEGNFNWKGGISAEPYCDVWLDKEFKKDIKARDNNKCQNPDCWGSCEHLPLGIHHVDYDKKNCHPNNLVTLCVSCNSRANVDREWHEAWYSTLLDMNITTNNSTYREV